MANAPKRSAEQWRAIVERYRDSDLSGDQFAAQEKISKVRLQWWGSYFNRRGTFARKPAVRRPSTLSFLPVRADAPPPAPLVHAVSPMPALEIVAPSGLVVRVRPDFDAGQPARVLALLGSSA